MAAVVPEISGHPTVMMPFGRYSQEIKDNGVTYLFVELDPGGLELFYDFTSAEGVGELGLRQALVLLSLAHVSGAGGASW